MDWPPPLRPCRESIEDHLATARARFPELQAPGASGSRGFVRDLISRGLIEKPGRVRKASGPGWGQRLSPADYRALIEILRLRVQGHVHRSRWLVWLWLRGRDYPIADVRAALDREVAAMLDELRAQINPSGRSTRPFRESYERNVAPSRVDSPFPGLGGLEVPLATLMFRPHEVVDMTVDLAAVASLVTELSGADPAAILGTLRELSATEGIGFVETAERFASVLPEGPMPKLLRAMAATGEPAEPFAPFSHIAGMIDNGQRGSAIAAALAMASDEQLQRARREIQRLRSGELEREVAEVVRRSPSADREVLDFVAGWASQQRAIHRGNPAMAAYLVGIYVLHDGDPIPVPEPLAMNANQLLRYLREQHAKDELHLHGVK